MLTFNNDKQFKKDFVKQAKAHFNADQIIQGQYNTDDDGVFRGCFLGCSLHSTVLAKGFDLAIDYSSHSTLERFGVMPEWLSRLCEAIFERLPSSDAPKFVLDIARAVPVGVNLDRVKWQFSAVLLKENIDRVLALDIADGLKEQVVSAIRGVLAVTDNALSTGVWDESAASAARSAAWSAAESAARSAAWSAASAAESAAESAAWSAAESAAWSAAWSAARSAAYQKYGKELIKLLKSAK